MSLLENIKIYDKFGNMLLSKGLKVVHKSGLVYTVHNVTRMGNNKDGKLMIVLAPPEEPRIDIEPEHLEINPEVPQPDEEKEKIKKHDVISEKSVLVCELDENEMYVEIPSNKHSKSKIHTKHEEKEESLEKMMLAPGEFLAVPEDEFEKEYEVR